MINRELVSEITTEKFQEIMKKEKGLVIVDFFAEWCLDPKTKLILNPCIKNIEQVSKGIRVLSFDENFKEEYAEIKSSHRVVHNQQVKILTKRGREIICTPEHLILTKNGFRSAKDLNEGESIATYLFSSYPEIEEDNRIFLNEESIRKKARELGLSNEDFFKELNERDLMNLSYNDERAHIIASLIGLLLSDGSLSMQSNNERTTEFFVGKEEDMKEIIKDLSYLNFEISSRKQELKGKINGREFTQKVIRMRNSKTSLLILLSSLGAIIGDKFINGIKIPQWIKDGPSQIKKSFLQGFLGGDGCKVNVLPIKRDNLKEYNKVLVNPLELHFYNLAKNSAESFGKDFSDLLEEFGVVITEINIAPEERWKRKDEKVSLLLKIKIGSSLESLYNYANIGFKYAHTKKYESAIAKEYILDRLSKIKERKIKKAIVDNMKDKIPINELAKELNLSYSVVSNWINGKEAGAIHDSINYDLWKKEYIDNTIAYDGIKNIEKTSGNQKEFISISLNNNTKMFVANDIIHHNCMPCVMMGPVIESLAQSNKHVKFAKVNVDDNPDLAQQYEISSIPCIMFFKNGKAIDKIIGAGSEDMLQEKIDELS